MSSGPYDLERFVAAQASIYEQALAELRAGCKRSHWMWFIFPQIAGLGTSPMSRRYTIRNLDEARAYLAHPLLGARLRACAEALLAIEGKGAREILGSPDDLKLRSSATLFACISPKGSVFHRLLERYFVGMLDPLTLERCGMERL
ncbi:DUF1810 domain-containing protein [Caldichromatium japonicum]|uniref:DUF1810 domain-containing protein n=1 Tax=Caldichromatium japonicum TaxID=2699430 RepID=A0A6G7VEH3_9GAMM|nr:DUF1810 domain-containing protein [Caldichromatium japonicum]QIK38352.1 DUF1810 domain-containing protein [Caldichromatium japonicum]